MIRQLNTLGEGRVKMAVQYKGRITFLTSVEMKIRKHCEHDNKDIMMVNMTFMWQWNEQFYKPSGRQVLLKRDKFIKPISYHFFFPYFFPAIPQRILWHNNRGKRMAPGSKVAEQVSVCSCIKREK